MVISASGEEAIKLTMVTVDVSSTKSDIEELRR